MFRIGKFWSLQDPDPSNNKQKIKKTLISTILWLLNDCISLKTDVPTYEKYGNKHLQCYWQKEQDPDLDPEPDP